MKPDDTGSTLPAWGDRSAKPRRIVQISTARNDLAGFTTLYALCNDGTLWRMTSGFNEWQQIEGVPPVRGRCD